MFRLTQAHLLNDPQGVYLYNSFQCLFRSNLYILFSVKVRATRRNILQMSLPLAVFCCEIDFRTIILTVVHIFVSEMFLLFL